MKLPKEMFGRPRNLVNLLTALAADNDSILIFLLLGGGEEGAGVATCCVDTRHPGSQVLGKNQFWTSVRAMWHFDGDLQPLLIHYPGDL